MSQIMIFLENLCAIYIFMLNLTVERHTKIEIHLQ